MKLDLLKVSSVHGKEDSNIVLTRFCDTSLGRDCTYYKILASVATQPGTAPVYVVDSSATFPRTFNMVNMPYEGPPFS